MFRIQGPDIIEIIRNSVFSTSEKLGKIKSDEIVVVSVIGSSTYHEEKTYKRAFRLILDSFGAPSLFKGNNNKRKAAASTKGTDADVNKGQRGQDNIVKEELTGVDGSSCSKDDGHDQDQDGKDNKSKVEDKEEVSKDDTLNLGLIDGFYAEDEHILFLHLRGAYDPKSLLAEWKEISSDLKSQDVGFSQIWAKIKTKFCRSLLLLFSLSHVVLVSNSSNFFDTSYIQLFRILDTVRHEVLPHASKLLGKIDGVSKQWRDHGRICSPRILFLFQVDSGKPLRISEELPLEDPIKDQQYKLEDEIYHVLRKCRIVTNISANSLFAIPSTQEYVFIYDQGVQEPELRDDPLSKLNHLTISFCEQMSSSFLDPTLSDYKNVAKLSFASTFPTIYSTNASKRLSEQRRTYRDILSDFRDFITSHTRLALDTGFDDDSKHVAEHKHFFVLPKFKVWRKAFGALSNYFVLDNHSDHRAREALALIHQFNNVDTEYLESQCAKVFPKVYSIYLKNLPEIYPEKMHKAKVSHVVDTFLKVARGPGVSPWVTKLINKCDSYWKRGHRQCEARSLHEHTCSHALHRFRVEDHLEVIPLPVMDESLPEKEHSTGFRILSYCNCGHRSGSRDEPFTIREANYNFYERLAQDCCDRLDRVDFPFFQPPLGSENKRSIDPQEMLLIYQQKLLGLLHHGHEKYEPVSDELEDELRQGPSLQFDNENEDEENENPQQNQNANQSEAQNVNVKEENQDKAAEAGEQVQTNIDSQGGKITPISLPNSGLNQSSNVSTSTATPPPVTSNSNSKNRPPEPENKVWRKTTVKASIEADFLPRTELENEYIYKRIRERKALAETATATETPITGSRVIETGSGTGSSEFKQTAAKPMEKKEVNRDIQENSGKVGKSSEYQNKIHELAQAFKKDVKKSEEERKEWLKWCGYEPKSSNLSTPTTSTTNIKSVKEAFYESFDLPMKTMALSMRFQPCWEQRSKRLPDHVVSWVNEYTKRRRFLFQDPVFPQGDYGHDMDIVHYHDSNESRALQRLSFELLKSCNGDLVNSHLNHTTASPACPEVEVPLELTKPAITMEDQDPNLGLAEELGKIQSENSVAWLLDDSSDSCSGCNDSESSKLHVTINDSDNIPEPQESICEKLLDTDTKMEMVEVCSKVEESANNADDIIELPTVDSVQDAHLNNNLAKPIDISKAEEHPVDKVKGQDLDISLEQLTLSESEAEIEVQAANEKQNQEQYSTSNVVKADHVEVKGARREGIASLNEEIKGSKTGSVQRNVQEMPSPTKEIKESETSTSTSVSTSTSTATPTPAQEDHETDTTMQYLPGMLHSRSLHGLLPLFSSWSLVCLGSSSLYTHTSGITHQPGFLTGSSTLLPWDKMVKAEAGVSKPIPRLIRGRKPTGRARRITDEFNVKVFIGVEYECKRGHRFLLESPEKILFTHLTSNPHPPNLKEAANKVAMSDMPLYYRCPCKESRDGSVMIAQLIRIHVITPKAPVHVTLNPRVQPGPSPCPIFHPGNMEPVKLTPSSYWILRLPYCYVGDDQVYVPSRDVARYNGRLLKDLYDVESMSPDETQTWELQNSTIS